MLEPRVSASLDTAALSSALSAALHARGFACYRSAIAGDGVRWIDAAAADIEANAQEANVESEATTAAKSADTPIAAAGSTRTSLSREVVGVLLLGAVAVAALRLHRYMRNR